jgi:hypothetical protein
VPDRRYDVVFVGFWLSHAPLERFASFWEFVADCLKPVDVCSSSTTYRDVKVSREPARLEERLANVGWRVKVTPTSGPFYWGAGSPA